jgi:hypothetical protein
VDAVLDIAMKRKEDDCVYAKNNCENAVHEVFISMDMMEEILAGCDPSMLYDLEKYHPSAYKKITDHNKGYLYEATKDNIERGIQEGVYREEIDVDILSKFRIGSIFLVFDMKYFPRGSYHLLKLCSVITDNFLHGLVTEKGRELITKYKQERKKQSL